MSDEGANIWKLVSGSAGGLFVAAGTTIVKMRERISNLEIRTKTVEEEMDEVIAKIDQTHDSVIRLEANVSALEEDVREGAKLQRKTNEQVLDKLTSIEVIVRSNGKK